MFRPLCLFFTILFLGLSFVVSAQNNVIALDTFDDDTVGQPPGTPEIGTSNHWGIPGHTIIDDYGSPRLRIVDIDSGGGTASTWYPTALPLVSEVSFTFRMEAYAGDYPVAHAFGVETGSGTGGTAIIWRDDGWIQWENSLVGHWSADRDYDIRMRIDCIHDPAAYEFCGHRELVKRIHDPLVDVDHALIGFGSTLKEAKSHYKGRIRAGMDESPSEEWAGIFGLSGPRDAGSPRISEDPGGISAGVTHPNADGHPPQNHP